jgi:hypothetical protein
LPAKGPAVETAVHTNFRAARWKVGAGMRRLAVALESLAVAAAAVFALARC